MGLEFSETLLGVHQQERGVVRQSFLMGRLPSSGATSRLLLAGWQEGTEGQDKHFEHCHGSGFFFYVYIITLVDQRRYAVLSELFPGQM